jgi:hypothetical protein
MIMETSVGELESYLRKGNSLPTGSQIFYSAPYHEFGHQVTVVNDRDGNPFFLSDYNQGTNSKDFYAYRGWPANKSVTIAIHKDLLNSGPSAQTKSEQERIFLATVTGNQPLAERSSANPRIINAAAWTVDLLKKEGVLTAEEAKLVKDKLGKPALNISEQQRTALSLLGMFIADNPLFNDVESQTNLALLAIGRTIRTHHTQAEHFNRIIANFPRDPQSYIDPIISKSCNR